MVPLERVAIRRCQQGEIQGLEDLYRIYAERVFRTCLRILGDRAAAEDQTVLPSRSGSAATSR